jgi:hypothetical protein
MAVYTPINKSADYFNDVAYSGTGSTGQSITVGFQPDLIWVKARNQSYDHVLFDSTRGFSTSTTGTQISPNLTTAQPSTTGGHVGTTTSTTWTTKNGTAGTSLANVGDGSATYINYNWKAGTTSGLATDGNTNITPASYSFNDTAKMSIIKWVGSGVDGAYLPHGLGVVPEFFIIKNTTDAEDWVCYHVGLTNALTVGSNQSFIELNSTAAQQTGTGIWYSTVPSSVNVRMANDNEVNASSDNYIGYFWRSVKGYSKFGSYIGNDDADNAPFIYTGFKPAFVMIKDRGNIENWFISDAARSPTNPTTVGGGAIIPNSANTETTTNGGYKLDMLSNGFKPRANAGQINGDGPTYIYCAWAENPFVTSDSIPTTAR